MIELKNVSKKFVNNNGYEALVLRKINLTVNQGESCCIIGPSGSGKSTLLNILGLLDFVSDGQYVFGGETISRDSDRVVNLRAKTISFIFQENFLIPHLTALENVIYPEIQLRKIDTNLINRAKEVLSAVGLSNFINQTVTKLSGGQRQRVCIARSLLKKPSVIIADEPSSALDQNTTFEIINLLHDLVTSNNTTLVISTHDKTVIDSFNRNIVELKNGELVNV